MPRWNLRPLLAPRSIAILGASESPDSWAPEIERSLRHLGYDGELYPINPKYEEVWGRRCLDGIDELVAGFVPRRFMKLRSETPLSLKIAPDDSNRVWVLTITDQPVVVTYDAVECDCQVGGDASDIYFAFWNRAPRERLTVTGDSTVIDLFHHRIQIPWA